MLEGPGTAQGGQMSVFDKLKGMLKGHEEQAGKAVDKAGDAVDARTRSKYSRHVDTAQSHLKQRLGDGGTQPGQTPPPPETPPRQ
jgi:hypothetical protein